jgi:hypothetical protein
VLKFARAFVLGDVLGCHMGQGGRLQNWDPPRDTVWGEPWMEWDRPAGDQDAAYAVLRNATALRRGIGKDFLLFGRMLRPLPVTGIPTKSWSLDGEANAVPAVEHASWQARDDRIAVALANWTDDAQVATIDLSTLEERKATRYLSTDGLIEEAPVMAGQPVELLLPPHACALLVVA